MTLLRCRWCACLGLAAALGVARGQSQDPPALARVGEELAGHRVVDVVLHPEFQRVVVEWAPGEQLQIEAALTNPDHGGACAAGDVSLYPRWELLQVEVEREDQPPLVGVLCERLAALDGRLGLEKVQGEPELPPQPLPRAVEPARPAETLGDLAHPLHFAWIGLAVAAIGLLAGPGWRGVGAVPTASRRALLLVMASGVVARLWGATCGVFVGPDAAYERLVMAWGGSAIEHPLYGAGFSTLMGPGSWLLSGSPDAVFWTNLALSMAAPPLAWLVAQQLIDDDDWVAPLCAGLAVALMPAHLLLAGSEVMHVSVATLELLSVAAALFFGRSGSVWAVLVAALAAGLAGNIRPEALAFAPVPVCAAAWSWWSAGPGSPARRSVPWLGTLGVAALAALVGWRASALQWDAPMAASPLDAIDLGLWWGALTPTFTPREALTRGFHVVSAASLSPVLWYVAALVALVRVRVVGIAVVGLLGLWWVFTFGPVIGKAWPLADALRLQLASVGPVLVLAGLGFGVVARRLGPRRWLAPVVLVAAAVPHLSSMDMRWASHEEWAFLREAAPGLPPDATVLYADHGVHADRMADVAEFLNPTARWWPLGDWLDQRPAADPLYVWMGVSCYARYPAPGVPAGRCDELRDGCRLTPERTRAVTAATDLDLQLPGETVEVGFWRVDGCD